MIKRHIEDRISYRVIAKRLREAAHSRLSPFTVFNAVKRVSLNSKPFRQSVQLQHFGNKFAICLSFSKGI